MQKLILAIVLSTFLLSGCKTARKTEILNRNKHTNILDSLLRNNIKYFGNFIDHKDSFRLQIIYTQIDRDLRNRATFTDYSFNLKNDLYFYPASTVKMPAAFLALEKLNEMNTPGVNKFTLMITDSSELNEVPPTFSEPLQQNPFPSVANYIKQVFLVSSNESFNQLYEFLGQEYIQKKLQGKGYTEAEIRHRLQISLTEEQNRQTCAISFYDKNSNLLYQQPAKYSEANFHQRKNLLGRGYIVENELINEPFDFSSKNRIYLHDLHNMLLSVLFPQSVDEKQRFNLTDEDYKLLYKYMSAYPSESKSPEYDTVEYYDTYGKVLLYGTEKIKPDKDIRIFNKEGDAYGFLTDIAYIVDFKNKVEFMLSATIYCNSDGIFNDDKYDYDSTGYPFMKNLGQMIYQYELKRKRKFSPDLSRFKVNYSKE